MNRDIYLHYYLVPYNSNFKRMHQMSCRECKTENNDREQKDTDKDTRGIDTVATLSFRLDTKIAGSQAQTHCIVNLKECIRSSGLGASKADFQRSFSHGVLSSEQYSSTGFPQM